MNRLRKLASVVLCAALIAGYAPAATQTALAADNSGAKTVTGSAAYAGSGSAAEPETASATASSSATKESGTAKTASGSTQTTDAANAATGKTEAATGTQAATKTQAATEASSTAVKAKLKTAGRTASETEFKNNGYPYGMDMGRSSVTLVMELESGTIDTAEWSRSTDKNGEYQAVDNSVAGAQISNTETKSSLVMDDTALGDEKYWYKCTVNGKESEAVQLVYASSYSNSGRNLQVLRYNDADYWYVCNGAMAYCVRSIDDDDKQFKFNVIGRYVKDGTEYWINTSYKGYWEMYSSDKQTPESSDKSTPELDAFRVSFNKDDSHRVIFEADLADGQTGLSVGADVMLANSSITNYADNASLKGIFDSKTGDITSVQMVGAASIDDALPTDPAFVLHYMDTPSKYWIGIYWESDNAYWSNNLYDNSRYQNNIKDTKEIDGQKVVTEVAGEDSLMTTSWTGLASGATVRFQFGVGSVEEAGATIKMQTTSTTIKLDDADSSLEYAVYGPDNTPVQLVDENGNPLFESDGTTPLYWRQVGDGETSITFYGLTANTKYTVMSRKKNTTDTPDKAGDITTSVDPTKPKDDSKPVECTEGTTSLAFINLNDDYTYQLQDKDGSIVSGTSWVEPSDGAYTFTNLHPGVDYYLTARTSSNTKSDKVKYTTRKTKLKYDANVAGSEIAVPASQDKSYDEAVTIPAMVPVREGYVFAGWSTSSDGSTTVYKAGSSFDASSDYDQTLYAIWKKPVRQIALIVSKPVIAEAFDNTASYSAAEGIAGISAVEWNPAAQTAEYDVKYTATVVALIADGYMAAADMKATVNGKSATVTVMNDSAVKVSYTFAAIRNMTDAEKISEAEQIIKDALADAPAYNGTNKNDLQKVVDKALSDAGITDVTADVEDFSTDNATTDKNGNITANIKIKTSSEQSDSPVTKKVDMLPSTDDEKTEYAKKVIEEAIKNIPDVNNVTREDVQKTVDEALAKAGIPGVEAVVGSINVNPADESSTGSVAGVVNIKSGSSKADFNINKDITRLPSNDEEKVEYTKKAVQDALAGMTISDTTTKDDIQNVIDNALSKAGITDVDVNVGDLDVTSPTTDTAGRFIGSINITSGSASGEAAVNKSVAKKPATDDDRIELAKTVIEEALAGTDVNNGMSISDIQNVIDKALAKAGLTDVSAVVDNVKKNNSTTDAAGSIIGNISISSGSKTGDAQVNRTIGTIPVTDDEKIQAAKNVVQQILDDTKMYNSTSKDEIQKKIEEALAKAGLGDVKVSVDDININSATPDTPGRATGTVSISSGSQSSSATINKTIAKTPSNDQEYAEAAKDAADNAISDIIISNGNTIDDIRKAVEDELARAGISGAQVITDDVVIKEATSKANGSVTGKVRVIVNGIEKEITINRIIPKLPMTDQEKADDAGNVSENVIKDITWDNETTPEEIKSAVEKAIGASEEFASEVTVTTDIDVTEATIHTEGKITGNVTIKVGSATYVIPIDEVIAKLKANVPDSGNVSVDSTQADAEAPKTELVSSADDVKKVLVLTRSELAKVNAGHNINIFLKVELKTADVTDEEKAVIEASKQDYTIGEYVDVSLIKDIDGSQVKVTELDGKIKISIIIPEKLRNTDANITRSYVLLRRHGSEQTAEIVDGIYDEASYTFTFETDRFSTYVIAYKDTVKTQPSDDDSDDDRTEQPTVTNPVIPGTGVNGSGTDAVTDNISGGSASDNGAQAEGIDGNAAGDSVSGAATGDSSPIIPLITVMLLGGACIVLAASKKKSF